MAFCFATTVVMQMNTTEGNNDGKKLKHKLDEFMQQPSRSWHCRAICTTQILLIDMNQLEWKKKFNETIDNSIYQFMLSEFMYISCGSSLSPNESE